jgi:hypothetical protein
MIHLATRTVTGVRSVGNSPTSPATREGDESFDAGLGLVLGDTWWQLGKNVARVLAAEGEEQNRRLEEWAAKVRSDLAEAGMNEPIGGVTPRAIMTFVETVMGLLEQKFDGKPIAQKVHHLTKTANDFNVYDVGQYLDIQEPDHVFWAVEYDFLFSKMDKSISGGGWLNAVGRCGDDDCRQFFIKARSDQRHHSDACRTRSANRKAYERTVGRGHTNRGRPRLRR